MTSANIIHITSGDCAGASLVKAGLPGAVFVWHDILYEGPRNPGWPTAQALEARARFLEKTTAGGLGYGLVLDTLKGQYGKVDSFTEGDRIVLWFDACLFDMAMLVHILACLRMKKGAAVELLVIDDFPGVVPYDGLGQLTPGQLAGLYERRRPVTDAQFEFAIRADGAFAMQAWDELETIGGLANAALPWVPAAAKRWLQERPDPETGLGRLQQLALEAVQNGNETPAAIFRAVSAAETHPQYWGDTTLWATVNGLADRRRVIIEGPAPRLPQWEGQGDLNPFRIVPAPPDLAEMSNHARALRERYLADPHRPGYHFVVPEGVHSIVDPNGALFWKGRYHLCYIYQQDGKHYWGHVSSVDLVHWRHHPPALGPGEGDEGIFSGGAFVDRNGVATLTYWRLGASDGVAIATSTDPNLDRWTKSPHNPVLASTQPGWAEAPSSDGSGTVVYGTADPSAIWSRNGRYYMLTGNLLVLREFGIKRKQEERQGDTAYLFVSDDLVHWTYLHEFYKSDRKWTRPDEDDMCPDFFALPASPEGGAASERHMLLFISHNMGCQYYLGSYANDRFTPDAHGRMTWINRELNTPEARLSWNDREFFAPESLQDPRGRRIMWTWVLDTRTGAAKKASGSSGELSLPRLLWAGEDGALRMRPVPELQRLRHNPRRRSKFVVAADTAVDLPGMAGSSIELEIELDPGAASQCAVKVCRSPGGEEETVILCDVAGQTLSIDTRKSSLGEGNKSVEAAPFSLAPGERLRLRVFVDKSVVEVFANDRQAIVRRIYPTRPDSLGVSLCAAGGPVAVARMRAWDMMPSNPY
jgi:beta-fructofuranosidase